MPSLQETLRYNIYADIIIPVINEYNRPRIEANPFEILAIAYILREKSRNWDTGVIGDSGPVARKPCVDCYCGLTWMGRKCGCASASSCCPACDSDSSLTAKIAPSTTRKLLTELARDARAASPWSATVNAFEKKIKGINTDLPNAWVFFQQIVDAFYEHTDFVKFFAVDYENGKYRDYVLPTFLDGLFRDGAEPTGLLFNTTTQGEDGGTKATTTITVDAALVGDIGTYYEIYSDATNRWIFWHDVDASGASAPAVPPIGGITDHYLKIDLNSIDPPADSAVNYKNQLSLAPGWAFEAPVNGGISDVIITVTTEGSKPPSVDAGPAHDTWGMVFVDGTTGVATSEVVEIDFNYATAVELQGRYFILYNGTESHMFFYTVNAGETPPAPVADFKHEILIADDSAPGAILALSNSEITDTGFWTSSQIGLVLQLTTVAAVDSTDVDKGTAEIGIATQVNNLVAPDGTDFGGDYQDDLDYARAWNSIVVPHMKSVGGPSYYLKPLRLGGIVCCCEDPVCTSGGNDCRECGANNLILSLMQRTVYPAITQDLNFNGPGTTGFVGPKSVDINL